jgi:hypothetical protein
MSWTVANNPLFLDLYRRHNERLSLVGAVPAERYRVRLDLVKGICPTTSYTATTATTR